jgi:outer membrane receptor protein involved in Fe transport
MRKRDSLRTFFAGFHDPGRRAWMTCRSPREFILVMCVLGAAVLLGTTRLHSQNVGKVSGAVIDAETGEPLIGCNVLILGTTLGASADAEGAYFILNVPPGKYDLQASLVGYQRVVQRGVIVNAGRTTKVDFKLVLAALQQQDVVVEATRPDVEPEKTSTSAIIRSEEVQAIAGMRDVSDVLTLAADITDGHFRGGREGEEYYTLQGMGIINPLNSSSAFMPIMSAVEEVEVITSGFGAQYGNAQSGVVNISMKEGRSDGWRTRFEVRTRLPGKKHFGPNVFDPNQNPYLALLNDSLSIWLQGDPNTNRPYFQSFGLNNVFGGDTAAQLAAAHAIWRYQTKRDMYRTYGNDMDYSGEVATGGPIDNGLRMFVALRSNVNWPVFPTEEPDLQRQIMGNVVADLPSGATLQLSGGYSLDNTNVFPSSNSLGFYSWLWDRILSVNFQNSSNTQLGLRFTRMLTPSTYVELKLNTLWTRRRVGSTPAPSSVADSLIFPIPQVDWDKVLIGPSNVPDNFYYLRGDDLFRDERTRTISFDASMTSQITMSHLLNGGVQFNAYSIDANNALSTREGSGGPVEIYSGRPFEGAFYLQDKMEFQGMIANVGLRLDVWNTNMNYYTNVFSPYQLVTDSSSNVAYYDPAASPSAKAPVLGRLQPRAGVSFPVSPTTVFHANYGTFMQRPPFQYIVGAQVTQGSSIPRRLGNPRLEPQTTNSYDLGIMQGVGEGLTLDVSGYYKDVKNLIEAADFTANTGLTYSSYYNIDDADIRGFRVALSKRRGNLSGSINYQYSVATGKSATPDFAPPAFIQDSTGAVTTKTDKVPLKDVLLSFDRTHNLIINIAFATDEGWGPSIAGVRPFGDMIFSVYSFLRSGRPYTSPSAPKLINGARSPAEYNTNARLTKRVEDFFGVRATFYFEVFNLFNDKILNYSYIFSTPNAMATSNRTAAYENYPIDDPLHGILYWNDTNVKTPEFPVDQSFLIYDNAPRSFNVGIVIDL